MGIPGLLVCVQIVQDNGVKTLERQDLDPFTLTGRDLVEWGVHSGRTLNMAVAIINHLRGWTLDAADFANPQATELASPVLNLYGWLVRAKRNGFKLTDVRVIDIAWPGWFSLSKWRALSLAAWNDVELLRIMARNGPTGVRWHLYQEEERRLERSPWLLIRQALEDPATGGNTPFVKTYTIPKPEPDEPIPGVSGSKAKDAANEE